MNEHATAPVETPADTLDDFVTVHRYPSRLPYRRSGRQDMAVPGDIALCGWVKQFADTPLPFGSANCLMCLRLDGLGLAR